MPRIAEAWLGAAVCIAVLSFGGTTPPFFLIPQLMVLALGIIFLPGNLVSSGTSLRFPVAAPLALLAIVLLQIAPIPAPLAALLRLPRDGFPARGTYTLSIAPYQTISSLLLLVTYLSAFFAVLLLCRDRGARRRLAYVLIGLGTFEAFYGLVQYLTGWQQIFTYAKKFYLEDATGTYINRNHFAGLLEMILPFAVSLALLQATALRRVALRSESPARSVISARELLLFVFWLFLSAAMFAGLVFSRSRMGIISALASLLAVLGLAGGKWFPGKTRVFVAAAVIFGVVGLIGWIGTDPVVTRFETLGQEYAHSSDSRISIWRDSWTLIRQHPVLGTGLGTFSVAYPGVQTAFLTLLVDHAHSDYLEIASEIGLPGAILVFGSIFGVLIQALRFYWTAKEGVDSALCLAGAGSIAAILVHSLADFNLYIPANALVFTVLLALVWSTTHSTKITRLIY